MIAVIFEVQPVDGREAEYLAHAARLRPVLDGMAGFVSVERFRSLIDPTRLLSLSFFVDEAAVARWRTLREHRAAQAAGRAGIFRDYRLRIASVDRDYGLAARREQAPEDGQSANAPLRGPDGR